MIPKRYAHATFENFRVDNDGQEKALDAIRDWGRHCIRNRGYGNLVFLGNPGTGKGHLACATMRQFETALIARQQAEGNYSSRSARCEYTTAAKLLREIQATFNGEGQTTKVFRRYSRAALLVIDEIGVGSASDFARDTLGEIIDDRSAELLPTIVVSNLSKAELTRYLDARAMDRLRDGQSKAVGFMWDSYRGGDSVAHEPAPEEMQVDSVEQERNRRKIKSILRHVS